MNISTMYEIWSIFLLIAISTHQYCQYHTYFKISLLKKLSLLIFTRKVYFNLNNGLFLQFELSKSCLVNSPFALFGSIILCFDQLY